MTRTALLSAILLLGFAAHAGGGVVWLEMEHEYGTIAEDSGKVACTMRLVNTTDSAIVITEVRPTCGCTTAGYPHAPIAPGDTAAIKLVYNPYGRPGDFAKSVIVRLNTSPRRTSLLLRGTVKASESTASRHYPVAVGKLRIDNSVLPFGEIAHGKQRNAYLSGYNDGLDTLSVSAEGTDKFLKVRVEPAVVPPGKTCAIIATFDTASCRNLWGVTESTFSLFAEPLRPSPTAVAGMTHISAIATIAASADEKSRNEAPAILLETDKIDFSPLASGTATRSFTITNIGKSPLEVRRLECDSPNIMSVTIDQTLLKHGKRASLTITASLNESSLLNTTLTIRTNDPANPAATVRLVGVK